MARLFLMIGLPGSGKSTLAASMQRTCPGLLIISTDRIRSQLFGDESTQGPWPLIWREVRQQFCAAVQQIDRGDCQAAIYDATNTRRRSRRAVIALARSIPFTQITGLWVDTPLSVCLERNGQRDRQVPEAVIQRMSYQLYGAPPSLQEGMSCLIRYSSLFPQTTINQITTAQIITAQMTTAQTAITRSTTQTIITQTNRGTEIPLFSMPQPNPVDLNS